MSKIKLTKKQAKDLSYSIGGVVEENTSFEDIFDRWKNDGHVEEGEWNGMFK